MSFYSGGERERLRSKLFQTDALRCENPVDSGTAGRTRAWRERPHGGGAGRGTGPNHPPVGSGQGQAGDCGKIGDRAANRATLGKALSAAGGEGVGGRAAVRTAAPHPTRADRPDRAEDHPETPSDSTHWSTRSLAQLVNVSPSSVGRIWRWKNLKPHRVRTFKLSNDPKFAEKTDDVVGLYLNPPAHAVVWSA